MGRRAALYNLGCKVNAYELEAMRQQLTEAGYEIVPFAPGADVYVINTCTVTNIADRKSRQVLHRAKKMNPNALVIAIGCYVQTKAEELKKDPAIDLLIGSSGKTALAEHIRKWFDAPGEKTPATSARVTDDEQVTAARVYREDISKNTVYEDLRVDRADTRTRAFLKVQDGCNNFCSYCIIPYARGRARSRRPEDAVAEAGRLAGAGVREVVLTGIHLCSYEYDLLTVIRRVAETPGIERVRLGSLEPGFLTEETVRDLVEIPGLCPHFHISLQSGCDTTLARMNRRYTTDEFRCCAERLRKRFARPSLTADIIVGFPGETEEEFKKTRTFVEETDFFDTHVFPYSRREGTRAATFPDQVAEAEKHRRADELIALGRKTHRAHLERVLGETAEVLFEDRTVIAGAEYWVGHTDRYEKAAVRSETDLAGRICRVKLTEMIDDGTIKGVLATRE